jgi:caffeoyl-CoA O-methyltransferase
MSGNTTGSTAQDQENGTPVRCFMEKVSREAENYAAEHTTPMSPLLEEIESYTLNSTDYPSMLTGRVEGRFLQLVVSLTSAKDIIDIGTFTGYSALAMAEVLAPVGKILTIEHNPDNARIAQKYFDRSPHGKKISLEQGEAINILKTLPDGATDLVFIDADKINYRSYYHESIRILRAGGFILADNALWYGKVFDPKDEDSKAMAEFNKEVQADDRVEKLFLTLRDGIYLIRKRNPSHRPVF